VLLFLLLIGGVQSSSSVSARNACCDLALESIVLAYLGDNRLRLDRGRVVAAHLLL
jgi:hypothetical protein